MREKPNIFEFFRTKVPSSLLKGSANRVKCKINYILFSFLRYNNGRALGPPVITFYLFKLELSVAKCRKDNAHVGVELLVVEHLSHLSGILPNSLVDSKPQLRTLQFC